MSSKLKSFFRRISKDHSGGGGGGATKSSSAASDPEGRKASSSAPPSILPSKRGHRDQESSASTDDLTSSSSKDKSVVGGKPQKFKKMSAPPLTRHVPVTIRENSEAMETESIVAPAEEGPVASPRGATSSNVCSGGVSATITINSVVPQVGSPTSSTPVIVDSTLKNEDPKAPVRRNSKDTPDGSRKQGYSLSKGSASCKDQHPVKSVSITKLEGNSSEVVSAQPQQQAGSASSPTGATRVVSVQRKLSPTKELISSHFSKSRGQQNHEDLGGNSSSSTGVRKISASTTGSTSGSKKFKKNLAEEDSAATAEEGDEEANVTLLKEKIKSLEKMVSDLVKNSEIKRQEIAALKMEIKRLKEAARERGHHSDEDNTKKTASSSEETGSASHPNGAKGDKPTAPTGGPSDRPATERVEELLEENRVLRSQLLHLGGSLNSSRLSDQEKEALLKGGSWGERSTTGATIGDWDNKSSSSEVSVACLQDRIMQMEETHYCTNEELQATLQELDDLREQLAESQAEVQQMQEEKQVLLESLTQQTERLSDTRAQNLTLKQLVIQHSENSHSVSNCVNTQRLMELLKSVEDDRERLAMMQEDLQAQKNAAAVAERRSMQDSQMYRDRMKSLESLVECSSAGKAAAEAQASELQETVKGLKLETSRLEAALAASKEKIGELEARLVGGGSVGEVLEVVRAEKEELEKQVEELTKRIHSASCDNGKLKEQISSLQDKLKVAEAHARDGLHDASARSERMQEERRQLQQQVVSAESALADAKATAQRHLQTKRELKTALSDVQKKLDEALENKHTADELMRQQKEQFEKQVEEWEQFQCDLLTTVRVANDFKTDAQGQLEKMQQENSMLKHKIGLLEKKVAGNKSMSSPAGGGSSASDRRNSSRPLSRGDSRVKSLIESLESGTTMPSTTQNGRPGNRSASTSSIETNNSTPVSRKTSQPLLRRNDPEGVMRTNNVTSPLKDSGNIDAGTHGGPVSPLRTIHRNAFTDSTPSPHSKVSPPPPSSPTANLPDTVKMSQLNSEKGSSKLIPESAPISILSNKVEVRKSNFPQLSGDKKDPLAALAQGGGSKRNALLKWCQGKTLGYSQVDITNFSSSWNDGLAFCAILDTYIPEKINYRSLNHSDKRANFEKALSAAESVGISCTLDINEMLNSERPNWQTVYNYVTSIYAHFET